MSRLQRLNSALYRGILCLYPRELRRDFGEDMAEVFSEDLADGWKSGGIAGASRVW